MGGKKFKTIDLLLFMLILILLPILIFILLLIFLFVHVLVLIFIFVLVLCLPSQHQACTPEGRPFSARTITISMYIYTHRNIHIHICMNDLYVLFDGRGLAGKFEELEPLEPFKV